MSKLVLPVAGHDDRAQVVPLFGVVVVVALAVALAAVRVGVVANDRARAQGAADATALAAAAADDDEAEQVAEANDAQVVSIDREAGEVTVEVRVGSATARASAHRAEADSAMSTIGVDGLHPDLVASIRDAESVIGRPLRITSGLRSRAEQEELWRNRHQNPYPVARPGTSAHERGLAVDVSTHDLADLVPIAEQVGLCRPLPSTDPVHFRRCADL